MTSQHDEKIITTYILSNISPSENNQTMKFGQLIEYNQKKIFFKNHARNETGQLLQNSYSFSEWPWSAFYVMQNSLNVNNC